MMKHLILTLLLSLSLTACESMSRMSPSNWSWSSFNPFSSENSANIDDDEVDAPSPTVESATAMELLTGTAPRFDVAEPVAQTPAEETIEQMPEVPVETVAADVLPVQEYHETTKIEASETVIINDEDLPITEARVAEVNAAIEKELANKPVAMDKPENIVVEPSVAETDVFEVAESAAVPREEAPVEKSITQPSSQPVSEEPVVNRAEGCPMVELMPSARSITYFENDLSDQMVARASISEIRGGCEYRNGGIEIDLDILMKGKITKLGRFEGKEDMEAFMTFPYFVAVSTPQGLPVDKQILATAMQFKPMIDDLDHAEKITQFIPLIKPREGANYKIIVGFQLNRKQMEYNRAVNVNRLDNKIVSPDITKRSRISVNPLAEED